jgi:hypothetical protein
VLHDLPNITRHKHKDRIAGYVPNHPHAWPNGCVYWHRLVMENHLGRFLERWEVVHHKDENSENNKLSNLALKTHGEHSRYHKTFLRSRKCKYCGKVYQPNNSKRLYCSSRCAQLGQRKVVRPTSDELKALVWSRPTTLVAKQLGVSDRLIVKWCRQVGIKKPPRGFWAKYGRYRLPERKKNPALA